LDYRNFACIACAHYPLERNGSQLICSDCSMHYPIQGSIPLLLPKNQLDAEVNGGKISLSTVRNIYDKVYDHDGLMGTDLDQNYDRVTKSILLDFGQPLEGKRLLDLGTGVGRLWDYVPSGVRGYAIDPSFVGVAKAVQRRGDITVSASVGEYLPYPDGFFDVVVSADTIEHTFSPERTLREIRRVLKPNGTFSASFPIPDSLRKWGWNQIVSRRFKPAQLLRLGWVLSKRVWLFGKAAFQPIDRDLNIKEWVALVQSAGFIVKQTIEWPYDPQIPIVYLVHAECN
jgi:SAM-dependent methyltransferase/uncharacterized protein YbaR (Trm112 family)